MDRRRDPQVVMFSSTGIADVDTTDAQRLGFTRIGLALILIASGIAVGWGALPTASQPVMLTFH